MSLPFQQKIVRTQHWDFELENFERPLVFTNGCFDILHPGHVAYLFEASQLGKALIVGLNSDDSVRRLKGADRPVNDFVFRSNMLAAYDFIDLVIEFSEDTPLNLVTKLEPNVLVKGGDYSVDEIVGKDVVEKNGGRVALIPFVGNFSSSTIIDKIKNG